MANYIQIEPGGEMHELDESVDVNRLRISVDESMTAGSLVVTELAVPAPAQGSVKLCINGALAIGVRIVEADTEV
jgi:hypothetical protein